MEYKEFSELIGVKVNEGDSVWVCDYRTNGNILEKPIRHIAPTKVILSNNESLPKNKTIYYADYHFRGITKSGKISSKIIAPYDNTGYRGYTGKSLNIFFSEEECRNFYKKQCNNILKLIENEKLRILNKLSDLTDDVKSEIDKHC